MGRCLAILSRYQNETSPFQTTFSAARTEFYGSHRGSNHDINNLLPKSVNELIMMKQNVSTTVQIKLHSLTNGKADLLAREYEAFQREVHGDADLYSATKQQASKVQRQKDPNPDNEQPVVLQNDVFDVAHGAGINVQLIEEFECRISLKQILLLQVCELFYHAL